MYFVYILINVSKDNWSYVGNTANLGQRFKDHMAGKTKSTKGFRPLKMIYFERYSDRDSAYKRELYLKSGIGREEKREIIKKYSGIV